MLMLNIQRKITKVNRTEMTNKRNMWIIIHYVGSVSTARANAQYFEKVNRKASANYFVDENEIWQVVEDKDAAWHIGANKYYNSARNSNSIGIELCCKRKGTTGEWYFEPQTVLNAIELTKYLMKKYDIPIERVARHFDCTGKKCLPIDNTELLTAEGWKKLSDIRIGDNVVTYNSAKDILEFQPTKDVIEPYDEKVYKTRFLEATSNHNLYAKPNGINSKIFKLREYSDLLNGNCSWRIKTTSILNNKGIDLTDEQIRLLVWIQGDGSYERKQVRFHLSKKRKIKRLSELLDALGIKHSKYRQKDGTTKIDIASEELIVDWAEKWLQNKCFTAKLLMMNKSQTDIFINELFEVDGCRQVLQYFSTAKENVDVVQAIACTNGYGTFGWEQKKDNPDWKTLFVTKIEKEKERTITHNNNSNRKQSRNSQRQTKVSCVTVDNGIILVRQNNYTFLIGNCPEPYVRNETAWQEFLKKVQEKGVDMFVDEEKALDYLVEKGRITNKDYWEKALAVTKNLNFLIIKWANDVRELEMKNGLV